MSDTSLTRRQFTLDAALALLAGCVITVSEACGSSSTSPTTSSSSSTDINGNVSANHGHSVVITGGAITAGAALVSVSIMGQATHNHTIAVSQSELLNLKNRQAITVNSTTDSGHQHSITFTPA